jgi:effector-binding domain-containing protein
MLKTPELIDVTPQTTAVIRLRIRREECRQHWEPAIKELFSVLGSQGIAPAGPVFDHHFSMPEDHFDFEIGVPTSKPVRPSGRVIASERPAFRAVKAVLEGDYEQFPEAWPEFMKWIDDQGIDTAADFWQIFAKGPESDPDPASWRTELIRAVKS